MDGAFRGEKGCVEYCKQENRARSRTGIKFSDKLVCTDKRFLLRLVRSRARFFCVHVTV